MEPQTHWPALQTQRLRIRAFNRDDLPEFSQYRNLPEVAHFQSWSEYCLADAEALYEEMNDVSFGLPGHWYQLALADVGTDSLLGDLALHFVDEWQLEIGFTLAPKHQGQGLATEAVRALLIYLFGTLGRHRVTAVNDCDNLASWQLLERLGFRREAHHVENILFKGAWGSEYQYALLRREWLASS
jgi:RimJ/RimL family protein N-acetyltransferase